MREPRLQRRRAHRHRARKPGRRRLARRGALALPARGATRHTTAFVRGCSVQLDGHCASQGLAVMTCKPGLRRLLRGPQPPVPPRLQCRRHGRLAVRLPRQHQRPPVLQFEPRWHCSSSQRQQLAVDLHRRGLRLAAALHAAAGRAAAAAAAPVAPGLPRQHARAALANERLPLVRRAARSRHCGRGRVRGVGHRQRQDVQRRPVRLLLLLGHGLFRPRHAGHRALQHADQRDRLGVVVPRLRLPVAVCAAAARRAAARRAAAVSATHPAMRHRDELLRQLREPRARADDLQGRLRRVLRHCGCDRLPARVLGEQHRHVAVWLRGQRDRSALLECEPVWRRGRHELETYMPKSDLRAARRAAAACAAAAAAPGTLARRAAAGRAWFLRHGHGAHPVRHHAPGGHLLRPGPPLGPQRRLPGLRRRGGQDVRGLRGQGVAVSVPVQRERRQSLLQQPHGPGPRAELASRSSAAARPARRHHRRRPRRRRPRRRATARCPRTPARTPRAPHSASSTTTRRAARRGRRARASRTPTSRRPSTR